MTRDTRHARPALSPAPAVATPPRVVVRLHTRRSRQERWTLIGEFTSREAAWDVIVTLPSGTHVWLNDVPTPAPTSAEPRGWPE